MIRGTTPTHTFELPLDVYILSEVWITYAQNDREVFTKTLSDCQVNGNILTLQLTQEDTLKLHGNKYTQIQIRCRDVDGNSLASDIIDDFTEKILKDGEI